VAVKSLERRLWKWLLRRGRAKKKINGGGNLKGPLELSGKVIADSKEQSWVIQTQRGVEDSRGKEMI